VNELAKGQKFMSLGAYNVSDDGNLLAYTTDNTGFRQFTLAVKDLRTGKLLADHGERVDSVAWANDNKTIFYTIEDEVSKRSYRLYRHNVGTAGPDTLIYEEKTKGLILELAKRAAKPTYCSSPAATPPAKRVTSRRSAMAEWKVMEPRNRTSSTTPTITAIFSIFA